MNPNKIPFLSLLGILGLGIGYLVGGGRTDPEGMKYMLYGLAGGTSLGVVLRLFFLFYRRS